ncbi:hypothetical protein OIO90_003893 [Microbotryomycetes sp. JL221]|nr:hypothetical protein OIO90_003893 [Microbotryomycetes sp. JL221]
MTVPRHIVDVLTPLHASDASFTLSNGRVTASDNSKQYLYRTATAPATQLVGELESVRLIQQAVDGFIPRLLGFGKHDNGDCWMLTEYHDMSSPRSAQQQALLGQRLALLHGAPTPQNQEFGFHVTTCCGVTEQDNTYERSWATFFAEKRIGDMIRRIQDQDLDHRLDKLVQQVIPALLNPLKVSPSLLHGDFWSGNVAFSNTTRQPICFDPSSYYGHSEADLGITRMFGGFSKAFYDSYHEGRPKHEPIQEYELRQQLYELYHHLNHMLMFGNSYKAGALRLIDLLFEWHESQRIES